MIIIFIIFSISFTSYDSGNFICSVVWDLMTILASEKV